MRRIGALLLLILLAVFSLVSCGEVHEPVSPEATSTDSEGEGIASEETVFYPSEMTKEEMLSYLNGTWRLCERGMDPGSRKVTTIEFDESNSKVTFTRDDGEWLIATFSLDYIFSPESGTVDYLDMTVDEYSKDLTSVGEEWSYYTDTASLTFLTGTAGDRDLLVVRNPGNGETVVTEECLGYNLMASPSSWLFVRDSASSVLSAEENNNLLRKGETFYAYCWYDTGDSLGLQEVYGYEHDEDLGFIAPSVAVMYSPERYGHYILSYPAEGVREPDMQVPETYCSVFAIVTTDENGCVTELRELEYMGYGVFWQDGMNPLSPGYVGGNAVHAYWEDEVVRTYDEKEVFTSPEASGRNVVYLMADHIVTDIKVLKLEFTGEFDSFNQPVYDETVVYETDELYPGKALILDLPLFNEMPNCGFSYVDKDGIEYKYALYSSGYDGSLLLDSFA